MQRCLFCKTESSASRSVEHIIPESLGNTLHVLPKGVVCDTCNNYFARKVEEPFLNSGAIRALRASQGIPNKRGRLIGQPAFAMDQFQVTIYTPYQRMGIIDVPSAEGVRALLSAPEGSLIIPINRQPPADPVVSRFLAKAALEAMALRGIDAGISHDYLVDHVQLDPIREHARRGDPRVVWPVSVRTIYDADKSWRDPDGVHQRVHEHDLLRTDGDEYFFVLALFGLELAINMGGPEIDGYQNWLREHRDVSPLYFGKNAHPDYRAHGHRRDR